MKRLLIYIITLVLALVAALYIKQDHGYIMLVYKTWVVELSVWTGLILLALMFILLHKFFDFISYFQTIPTKYKIMLAQRRQNKVYAQTSLGLLNLAEGNFKQAYQQLSQSAVSQSKPLINYLTAAKAAQELGHINSRDECLRKAFECSPKSGLSIGIMQSNLQCRNHEYEAALATLNHLQQKYGVNKLVLNQLLEVYLHLKDWYKLVKLLPDLKRYKIISDKEVLDYEVLAAENYCKDCGKDKQSNNELDHFYNNELSKKAKLHYKVVEAYVSSLVLAPAGGYLSYNSEQKQAITDKAQVIIEKAFAANPSVQAQHNLIILLGKIIYTSEQFKRAEKLLKNNSYNLDLLFVLGKLAISLEDYEKAYQYLNQAVRLTDSVEYTMPIRQYLAYVMVKQGLEQEGLDLFINSFSETSI